MMNANYITREDRSKMYRCLFFSLWKRRRGK